jgi:hypothetical protein
VCSACHVVDGIAGDTAFLLDPHDMLSSLRAASHVADRLVDKPTGLHPDGHGGGTLLAPGSEQFEALAFWVGWTAGNCDMPHDPPCLDVAGRRTARRITHEAYTRSVMDLLRLDEGPSMAFAPDVVVDGFSNDVDALVVQQLLADQYRMAAEELAWRADVAALVPCDPWTTGNLACATLFVEAFGLRAFRRPLTREDVDRYLALWDPIAVQEGYEEGLRWVITAMLQSPHFLYRSELGLDASGAFELTDWELAAELAYTIHGTTPDEALLAAAEAGTLRAELRAHADRLLADPRAQDSATSFISDWLQLDQLQTVSREGLTQQMRSELEGDFGNFVLTHTEMQLADLLRDGLLTQKGLLTTHALPDSSSPVHRGVLVRQQLLCEELPPPPPNLDTSPPEVDPSLSTRERYAAHSENPACAACHDRIDPLGFAFEHYDQFGEWRETEGPHPIDASGHVDGVLFDGVGGLTEALLDDSRLRDCYVSTWRRALTGMEACAEPTASVGVIEPMRALADRVHFTLRTGDGADTLAAGTRIDLTPLPTDPHTYGGGQEVWVEVDDWLSGYCVAVIVQNSAPSGVLEWSYAHPPDGSLDGHWSCGVSMGPDAWIFTGEDWNARLAPGEEADFGFCATR